MGKQKNTSQIPRETERQGAELDAMRRMLSVSSGTCSLSISICNSPALRDYLIKNLKKGTDSIEVVKLTKDSTDIFSFVSEKVSRSDCSAIFVTNIEPLLPSDTEEHKILKAFNASRELWKESYHCPIVFWVAEYAAALISIQARDIWSWISHQFEFISEEAHVVSGMSDMFAGNILAAGNLPVDQKQFRIAELEQRITEAGETFKSPVADHVLLWLNELAYIYYRISDLSQAEHVLKKTIKIKERLGRQEDMAIQYNNLGLIYRSRGELDKSEEVIKKSLEIDEKLGRQDGLASSYNNLGLIYRMRGELDRAEEMHKKSLEIAEILGDQKGLATQYGNLGLIYLNRGELDRAEEMHKKSLEINEILGDQMGVSNNYSNIGQVYGTRGELAKAEEMIKKSLVIDERLGLLEGVASSYANLGVLNQMHGELAKAEESFIKAHDLFLKIGMPHMVEKVQGSIESLKKESKDEH